MDETRRPMSLLYLAVPGLPQVYCGAILRGILIFLAAWLLFFLWILDSLYLLDFLGYGLLNEYPVLPFLLGLAVWVWGAYDGYTCSRKMLAGEIPWHAPVTVHIVLFIIGAAVLVFFAIAVTAIIYFLFGLSAMVSMYSHDEGTMNITLAVQKEGDRIAIVNTGNETPYSSGFFIVVNGRLVNTSYKARPGESFTVNGSRGQDHVIVFVRNYVSGTNRTLLDSTV